MDSTMQSGFHFPLTTVNEKELGNIKICEVTLEGQAQHLEPSDKEDTETSADIPEIFAEGSTTSSSSQRAATKPTSNQKNKSERENVVARTKSKDSNLEKKKVHPSI